MKKYFVGLLALLVLLTALIVLLALPRGNAANPSPASSEQTRIEGIALSYAQAMALQGTPTSVVSKKMSVEDFKKFSDTPGKGDLGTDEVWLVLFKGIVVVSHPSQQTSTSQTTTDNMWVDLTPAGQVLGWGTFPPGTSLDLTSP